MENLYETIEAKANKELLATGNHAPVAISMEPGNGIVPYGTVIYRKSGVLFAPAAAGQLDGSKELLVLADDVDTTTSETIAAAAKAYEGGTFLAGAVKIADGEGGFAAVTAAQELILRQQGITLRPFDNWATDDVTADNTVEEQGGGGSDNQGGSDPDDNQGGGGNDNQGGSDPDDNQGGGGSEEVIPGE